MIPISSELTYWLKYVIQHFVESAKQAGFIQQNDPGKIRFNKSILKLDIKSNFRMLFRFWNN